jgi:hypothetical protein
MLTPSTPWTPRVRDSASRDPFHSDLGELGERSLAMAYQRADCWKAEGERP